MNFHAYLTKKPLVGRSLYSENRTPPLKACIVFSALAVSLAAQPSLRIVSPSDGAVMRWGESLKVSVEATGSFMAVIVFAGAIGSSKPLPRPPYEFTIPIPPGTPPGKYPLTADGGIAPGQRVASKTITIQVEPADSPLQLRAEPSQLQLTTGGKGYIRVFGVFADGKAIDLTPSEQASFSSDAPGAASVDATRGIVSALAPGSAHIKITYRNSSVVVPVTISPPRK